MSSVSITYLNCPAEGDSIPTIADAPFASSAMTSPVIPSSIASLAYGVHRLDFNLAPGDWRIDADARIVNASSDEYRCGIQSQVTILPGKDRHLVFMSSGIITLGPSCSVAGTLPAEGLMVRLIGRNGGDIPLTTDDGAYYSDNFGRGKLLLVVTESSMSELKVDIPLDFSDQEGGEFCDKKLVRNVTFDDLRAASFKQ